MMAWYWYLVLLVVALLLWTVNYCRNNLKEKALRDYWRFASGNLNVYKGDSVILDHQLGVELDSKEVYKLLIKKHGRARCRWCYQRTEAVVPAKSLNTGRMIYRSLACNKCGCFILNDEVAHLCRR
jgi:hypothetical protein